MDLDFLLPASLDNDFDVDCNLNNSDVFWSIFDFIVDAVTGSLCLCLLYESFNFDISFSSLATCSDIWNWRIFKFSSVSCQIFVRFLSNSCHTMVFFKNIVTYINSPQPRRLKAFSVLFSSSRVFTDQKLLHVWFCHHFKHVFCLSFY